MQVIMLSNDAASRRLAEEEGVHALGAASYVRTLRPEASELLDMVAAGTVVEEDPEEAEGAVTCISTFHSILDGGLSSHLLQTEACAWWWRRWRRTLRRLKLGIHC